MNEKQASNLMLRLMVARVQKAKALSRTIYLCSAFGINTKWPLEGCCLRECHIVVSCYVNGFGYTLCPSFNYVLFVYKFFLSHLHFYLFFTTWVCINHFWYCNRQHGTEMQMGTVNLIPLAGFSQHIPRESWVIW